MKILIPEITFSAAHYIPGHKTCSGIHGHTYFVRNLEIDVDVIDSVGMSIDFGLVKGHIKDRWDHKLILPKEINGEEIQGIRELMDAFDLMKVNCFNMIFIKHTTAEWMATEIRRGLGVQFGWSEVVSADRIHLELWEGPNQAVKV